MASSRPLSAAALMSHVRVLAEEIGPRPAGHVEEMRARQYIRQVLARLGFQEVETLFFPAPDTWGYGLNNPMLLALLSNLLPGQVGRVVGGLTALGSAYAMWRTMRIGRQPLTKLAPRRQSATLIARVPAAEAPRRKLVLLAHTDSNKDRPSFDPRVKRALLSLGSVALGVTLGNGLAQLSEALTPGEVTRKGRRASVLALLLSLLIGLYDEQGDYIPGANDNASAVACVLGLAARLQQQPLRHTEVWLAFTGAEEVGCLGAHALLDTYGDALQDAWFLDFEMVGSQEIAYVTRHTGFSYLTTYRPDPASLAWARAVARAHPDVGIRGRELVIGEEVGALRLRGYRGLCLAGLAPDGWLENWHQATDDVDHIVPAGLETAARFAWEMLQALDAR